MSMLMERKQPGEGDTITFVHDAKLTHLKDLRQ